MKRMLQLLIAVIVFACPSFASAGVLEKPGFFSYVYDYANVISASDEYLISTYAQSVDALGVAQVITVTVESLSQMDDAEYCTQLMNTWGIGRATQNDGVLLLLAPNERRIRIGTGSGINKQLSNEVCGILIDKYAIPSLSVNEFSSGMVSLVKATCAEVMIERHPIFDDKNMIIELLSN